MRCVRTPSTPGRRRWPRPSPRRCVGPLYDRIDVNHHDHIPSPMASTTPWPNSHIRDEGTLGTPCRQSANRSPRDRLPSRTRPAPQQVAMVGGVVAVRRASMSRGSRITSSGNGGSFTEPITPQRRGEEGVQMGGPNDQGLRLGGGAGRVCRTPRRGGALSGVRDRGDVGGRRPTSWSPTNSSRTSPTSTRYRSVESASRRSTSPSRASRREGRRRRIPTTRVPGAFLPDRTTTSCSSSAP